MATDRTTSRDRSVDDKDGFHGAVTLDDTFPPLVAACLHLAGAYASFSKPDPAVIHQGASCIVAGETLSAIRPQLRRARY
ncbi:hypothetical protein AB0G86_02145 [Streptomyces scabiei]|uniref:hypothetical protein n=1 Tax=Streptomyces scabiei TaxID=1930 RepID=UPI0034003FA5